MVLTERSLRSGRRPEAGSSPSVTLSPGRDLRGPGETMVRRIHRKTNRHSSAVRDSAFVPPYIGQDGPLGNRKSGREPKGAWIDPSTPSDFEAQGCAPEGTIGNGYVRRTR